MNHRRLLIINNYVPLLLLIFALCHPGEASGGGRHFISDPACRAHMENQLKNQMELAHLRASELFGVLERTRNAREKEALQFLLAYSPLSDLADYTGEWFLENVRYALSARDEFSWGRKIPEEVFRHFVLPPRVNNENMDRFRANYYRELKQRVRRLPMKAAALEINHWCHEKVTYKGTDIRTSGPCSTIRTAYGRCGEESVLTVAALRTVGIPARQCYTPRWAHCDDNHAWVEVWVDGKWRYLGACEPDSDLDRAWFTEPARRAMLVHAKVFGWYNGPEETISKNDWFSEINVIQNYAVAKTLTITVLDRNHQPAPDAEVGFRLYNYAEYYPLAVRRTDANGVCSLTVGLGDLLIWANKGVEFGYGKISAAHSLALTVILNGDPERTAVMALNMNPPVLLPPFPVSEQGKLENQERLKAEDVIRSAYEATFISEAGARAQAEELGLDPASTWEILHASRGNWKEIIRFLGDAARRGDSFKKWAIPLLKSISEKDLRDTPALVLWDHLTGAATFSREWSAADDGFFRDYILGPRVRNELLTPYRAFFRERLDAALAGEFYRDPAKLAAWIRQNIVINSAANYYRAPLTPVGAFELKVSDPGSRDVLFVAICRSIGVPARLEPGLLTPQYCGSTDRQWRDVIFEGETPVKPDPRNKGYVRLSGGAADGVEPAYYIHFTLARFSRGQYRTLDYEENMKVSAFPSPLALEPGSYMLSTGNRLGDGGVLSELRFFNIKAGETVNLPVQLRKAAVKDVSLGMFDLREKAVNMSGGGEISFEQLAGERGLVIGWLDPDAEPTKHVLAEMQQMLKEYEAWGGAVVLLPSAAKLNETFRIERFAPLPKNHCFIKDDGDRLLKKLESGLNRSLGDRLPVFLAVDATGRILRMTEGYRIGVAEQLLRVLLERK